MAWIDCKGGWRGHSGHGDAPYTSIELDMRVKEDRPKLRRPSQPLPALSTPSPALASPLHPQPSPALASPHHPTPALATSTNNINPAPVSPHSSYNLPRPYITTALTKPTIPAQPSPCHLNQQHQSSPCQPSIVLQLTSSLHTSPY
ncbi:hypothetical protein Pmani_006391 [Petrolisthes manimaculis]|uniref:Uncharacterized protein n=1 Tax=Petrolisthes manimaculis TaxID=1843537 RepID=A0AAE1QAG1_9EUCA|nr:hypothetical protein Pmani_006391 [Petrolisthes manimaculis]